MLRICAIAVLLFIGTLAMPTHTALAQEKPDWQKHIDWCSRDTGAPDCPAEYVALSADLCLVLGVGGGTGIGNRACLIQLARLTAIAALQDSSVKGLAMQRTMQCQCHNHAARDTIVAAGEDAVCAYLRNLPLLPMGQ